MNMIKNMLFELCNGTGVSGDENAIASVCERYLPNGSRLETDSNLNIYIVLGEEKADKTIMLNAHGDIIGLRVTNICEGGFLHVAKCGGIDSRVLAGSPVKIHGKKEILGIVCSTPPHLSSGDEGKVTSVDDTLIDTGLSTEEAQTLISLGDSISLIAQPCELLNNRISAVGTDNRASVATVLYAAQLLAKKELNKKVIVAITSREELNSLGAKTAAFKYIPDECICLDVSFAKQPDNGSTVTAGTLSKGAMICKSATLDKEMTAKLIKKAEENNIPYQIEVCAGRTGTDADHISITAGGIKTALLSLPQRYMHTQAEVIDLSDIKNTAELICAYITED